MLEMTGRKFGDCMEGVEAGRRTRGRQRRMRGEEDSKEKDGEGKERKSEVRKGGREKGYRKIQRRDYEIENIQEQE